MTNTAASPAPRPALGVDANANAVLALIAVAQFMVILDATIVNVALPTITVDVGFSEQSLSWVLNAYTLMFGGFLLLGGRLADRLGRRRLFVAGIAVFTGASLICGVSQSEGWGWTSGRTLAGFAVAAALIVAFVFIERRHEDPLVPLRIFSNRGLAASDATMLVVAAALFGMFFFLTLYLQQVLGYSALKTGVAYLPLTLTL